VRLLDAIGVDYARKYIAHFGFNEADLPPNLSMSLGTASLAPIAVARGYAAFANGGYLITPWLVDEVKDRNGKMIFKEKPAIACHGCGVRVGQEIASNVVDGFDLGNAPTVASTAKSAEKVVDTKPPADAVLAQPAIDARVAYQLQSMMRDVVQRGTGTPAKVLERPDVGGKTGSTNDHRDAWFSGFGGGVVTTVWVGRDDFKSLGYREYGGKAALPIWIGYMGASLKDVPLRDETPPNGIVTVAINRGNGNLVPEGTPGAMKEFMKSEDYDRIVSGGYDESDIGDENTTQSYDIF